MGGGLRYVEEMALCLSLVPMFGGAFLMMSAFNLYRSTSLSRAHSVSQVRTDPEWRMI